MTDERTPLFTIRERDLIAKVILTAGCMWEIYALWSPKHPTITELRMRLKEHPRLWPVAKGFDLVNDWHFQR